MIKKLLKDLVHVRMFAATVNGKKKGERPLEKTKNLQAHRKGKCDVRWSSCKAAVSLLSNYVHNS